MRTIDTLGKRCPIPVIELAKAIPEIEIGEEIEVLSDDAAAKVDIPVWCRMKGQHYVGAEPRDHGTAYRIRRVS